MIADVTSQAFFEEKYQRETDPWSFASSAYEQGRYAATIDALRGNQYRRAFEPGCSIGILTERLAQMCDAVEAIEIAPSAAAQAQVRCAGLPQVHIRCGALPDTLPMGSFDLIVLSEIGYYFDEDALRELVHVLTGRLTIGGTLLAVHWLGESPDHVLSGDRVHEIVGAQAGLRMDLSERHTCFRLERWRRT